MKRIHIFFLVGEILVFLVAAVHVCISYVTVLRDRYTSFPAETAFLWLIPYGIAMSILGIAWSIVYLKKR